MKRSLLLPAYLLVSLALAIFSIQPAVAQKDGEGSRVDSIIERANQAGADQPELLYVTNQGEASVAVIDMSTNQLIHTVDLQEFGFSENAQPHHAIAEPDGSAWYVGLIAENRVLKFNPENELIGQLEFEAPGLLALHPEEDLIYVARSMMAVDPPQSIGVANRTTMDVLQEIDTFFPRPHALLITPDGRFVYTASLATNQIMGIDADQRRGELTTLDGPTQVLIQFSATPDGQTIIGGGQTTGQLLIFEAQQDGTLEVDAILSVGAQPWHPVIDHEGRYAYVPNKESNTVSVVDVRDRQVVDTIEDESFAQPHGSALSADGRYLYVSNNNSIERMQHMAVATPGTATRHEGHESHEPHDHGEQAEPEDRRGTVSVIDLETRQVTDVITVGEYPTGMGTHARR